MARGSFLTTPFVDLDPDEVSVAPFRTSGELCVVLRVGEVSIYVYDEAMLIRLAEIAARGRDLLAPPVVVEPQPALADAEAEA